MTALSATIYTFVSYGAKLFFPFFFVIAGAASCLALFVFFPVICMLVMMRKTTFLTVVTAIMAVSFAVFFIWNYASLIKSEDLVHGGRVMVADGVINTSGYVKILVDSLVTSAIAGVGTIAFWLLSLRSPKPRSEND